MSEVGMVENPTFVRERSQLDSELGKGASIEVKTTMPLEGTMGGVIFTLDEEYYKNLNEMNAAVNDPRIWSKLFEQRMELEFQRHLAQMITAKILGPDKEIGFHANNFHWLNKLSIARAKEALDAEIGAYDGNGLRALAYRKPQEKSMLAGGLYRYNNARALSLAVNLNQRLESMPQVPKTPQQPNR